MKLKHTLTTLLLGSTSCMLIWSGYYTVIDATNPNYSNTWVSYATAAIFFALGLWVAFIAIVQPFFSKHKDFS